MNSLCGPKQGGFVLSATMTTRGIIYFFESRALWRTQLAEGNARTHEKRTLLVDQCSFCNAYSGVVF